MSAVEMAVKTCTKCGETKPLSGFYRDCRTKDGHGYSCKDCVRDNQVRLNEQRRAEMGDEAWLAHKRKIVQRHRIRTGNINGHRLDMQRRAAIRVLIAAHRAEFDHLMLLAKRGELPDTTKVAS